MKPDRNYRLPAPRSVAHAAGWDAGERSMRQGGRVSWNHDDYEAALREYHRLLPDTLPPEDRTP